MNLKLSPKNEFVNLFDKTYLVDIARPHCPGGQGV